MRINWKELGLNMLHTILRKATKSENQQERAGEHMLHTILHKATENENQLERVHCKYFDCT